MHRRPRTLRAVRHSATTSRNQLLSGLTAANRRRVQRQLVPVSFATGEVVYKANGIINYVYFPETAVLSFIVNLKDGPSVEAAMAGAEGLAGLPALQEGGSSNTLCICQVPGDAQRLSAAALLRIIKTVPQFAEFVNRYVGAYIAQVTQTAACNRHHSVSQRCARWLLMTQDRVHGAATFPLTQAFLSHMLGIRREAVSEAASAFQRGGMISYSRGRVTILDRQGLETRACECYALVEARLRHLYA